MSSYQQQSNLSKFFLLCLITLSSFFLFSDSTQAGNPTKYVTVHEPYTRLSGSPSGYYAFNSTPQWYSGYDNSDYLTRVFIPPGASSVDLLIRDATGNVVVARQGAFPVGEPDPNNPNVQWGYGYKLEALEGADGYVQKTGMDQLYVLKDAFFPTNGLPVDRGNWLYIKFGGGQPSWYYQIQWAVWFYPKEVNSYNYWWDNYGSNPDGSINWEKDVESVYQYHAKLKGDLDDDDDVDANDYSIFQINYKNTDSNNIANLDGRSPVDANDYAILQKRYTGSK